MRRYPIEELPLTDRELGAWIIDRFKEKDELLENFYKKGDFSQACA